MQILYVFPDTYPTTRCTKRLFTYIDNSGYFSDAEFDERVRENLSFLKSIEKGEEEYRDALGWYCVNEWAGESWLKRYEELAEEIKEKADALVVIGIGGSNQAARAVYEALRRKGGTELIWSGNNISAHSYNQTLEYLKTKKNVYVNCIAKNFETLEPGVAFRIFRRFLKERYGEGYNSHIIVTFTENSSSWKMAEKHGYITLPFPSNIGGRYTALSPVALFPLAVASIDIRAMSRGAEKMERRLKNDSDISNIALRYASARTFLYEKGKKVELLSYFAPRLFRFGKWWKQLFGESEGKDGKALLPMDTVYSEDLHSLGQFIQDGTPVLFETFLNVKKQDSSLIVLEDDVEDGFGYLNGMDLWDINRTAFKATLSAHSRRFPCLLIDIPALDEESFGELFYFFEFACYISCRITGVNPFNQDGVEAYKRDMFTFLGKP